APRSTATKPGERLGGPVTAGRRAARSDRSGPGSLPGPAVSSRLVLREPAGPQVGVPHRELLVVEGLERARGAPPGLQGAGAAGGGAGGRVGGGQSRSPLSGLAYG